MDNLNIQLQPKTCVTVCGDIHEHEQQFNDMVDKVNPTESNLLVFVGDIYNKGFGVQAAERITDRIRELVENKVSYIVKGNHEIKSLRNAKKIGSKVSDQLRWLNEQPLALSFVFNTGTRLTIVHGGVTPHHTWRDLAGNSELVYIRTLNENGDYIPLKWETKNGQKVLKSTAKGKPWHELYDGRFGYIASGHHAQADGDPKFYNYSCNLDTACYHTGILTAQKFDERGKVELIQIKGIAVNSGKMFRYQDE